MSRSVVHAQKATQSSSSNIAPSQATGRQSCARHCRQARDRGQGDDRSRIARLCALTLAIAHRVPVRTDARDRAV
jgi:hypothetical protein